MSKRRRQQSVRELAQAIRDALDAAIASLPEGE